MVQALLLQPRERADQQQSRLYDISSFSPSNAIVPIAAEQGSFPTDIGQQVAMTTGNSSPVGPGFWKVSSMNPNPRLQASVQPAKPWQRAGLCRPLLAFVGRGHAIHSHTPSLKITVILWVGGACGRHRTNQTLIGPTSLRHQRI